MTNDKPTDETVHDAVEGTTVEKEETEETEESKRDWKVRVQPVGIDTYELTAISFTDDEQTEEEPFEVFVPGGRAAINKRAAELVRAKRLRDVLGEETWLVE